MRVRRLSPSDTTHRHGNPGCRWTRLVALAVLASPIAGCGLDWDTSDDDLPSDRRAPAASLATTVVTTVAPTASPAAGNTLANLVDGSGLPGLGNLSESDTTIDDAHERCLAERATSLSPADLDRLDSATSLGGLSVDGQETVSRALNACLSDRYLAARLAEAFTIRLDPDPKEAPDGTVIPAPEFTACIRDGMDHSAATLVESALHAEQQDAGDVPSAVRSIVDPCATTLLRDAVQAALAEHGLDTTHTECVAVGFVANIEPSDYLDVGGLDGELSAIQRADLRDLLNRCGLPRDLLETNADPATTSSDGG